MSSVPATEIYTTSTCIFSGWCRLAVNVSARGSTYPILHCLQVDDQISVLCQEVAFDWTSFRLLACHGPYIHWPSGGPQFMDNGCTRSWDERVWGCMHFASSRVGWSGDTNIGWVHWCIYPGIQFSWWTLDVGGKDLYPIWPHHGWAYTLQVPMSSPGDEGQTWRGWVLMYLYMSTYYIIMNKWCNWLRVKLWVTKEYLQCR